MAEPDQDVGTPMIANAIGQPFKLRAYQDEMLERCLNGNSIIVLDTGAGKTHIAMARIRLELESCASDQLVWFIAPTVALCQQHSKSFQNNLPAYQLRTLIGDDNVERWTDQVIWDAVLKDIRIVISTYGVLHDALSHGFVTMSRLALCVIDEAHHCMKKHPCNMIMQNFYRPTKAAGNKVPHILGLSASPVMRAKSGELEILEANLHSHVITPKMQRSELMQYVHVPELIKLEYGVASMLNQFNPTYLAFWRALDTYDLETDPYVLDLKSKNDQHARSELEKTRLKRKTYSLDQLKGLCTRIEVMLRDVGPTALNWYIKECFNQLSSGLEQANSVWMPETSEKEKRHLTDILASIATTCTTPTNQPYILSPKTQLLLETLRAQADASFTGILFAEQRAIVATLAEIITNHPLTAGLFNVGTFVGNSNSSSRKSNIGDVIRVAKQQQTLEDFHAGKKNLIIATSVLEEGIDVSSCQTVICFDAPCNLVAFVQRRGRARKRGSRYIILIAEDDRNGQPARWNGLEEKMKNAYMEDLRNAQLAAQLEQRVDINTRQYLVPSTGALLTPDSAKAHLYHFCATLQSSGYTDLRPTFTCREDGEYVHADVVLPISVHPSVRRASSHRAFLTERGAMTDAAFEAYVALHQKGLVNDHLLPLRTNIDDIPTQLSRASFEQVLPRHNAWSLLEQGSTQWSKTTVQIEIEKEVQVSLDLFIPTDCPPLPDIPLYWTNATKGAIKLLGSESVVMNPADLAQARTKTCTLLSAVNPLASALTEQEDCLAALISTGSSHMTQSQKPLSNLNDTDPNDYGLVKVKGRIGRAYIFRGLVPAEVELGHSTLARLSSFPKKRDFLRAPDPNTKDTPDISIPVDECMVEGVPVRYAIAAACMPSLLHCVENAILARELQQNLLGPVGIGNLSLITEATTSSAASSETNYERLEYLGDAVLKYCTHVQLTAQHPTWPESFLTADKGRTNGNASLSIAALRFGLERFISTRLFTGQKWTPPILSDATEVMEKIPMSTKVLADVVEALIGASFIDKGLVGALACIKVFLPDEPWLEPNQVHGMLFDAVPDVCTPSTGPLEEMIGHHFQKSTLLREAMTHASYTGSDSSVSYERLEFLGDAILDQIIVPEMFAHNLNLKNHQMHRLRQALANAHFLGFICMELSIGQERTEVVQDLTAAGGNLLEEFHLNPSTHVFHLFDFLRCAPSTRQFIHSTLVKHAELRDEIMTALQHGTVYPWAALYSFHPEKLFSDLIESVLGAIYIDSHGSLDACRIFLDRCGILKLMRRFLDEAVDVSFPKEKVGILADKERVYYSTVGRMNESGDRVFDCTVKISDREIVTTRDCNYRDEAEIMAASEAAVILAQEYMGKETRKRKALDEGTVMMDA